MGEKNIEHEIQRLDDDLTRFTSDLRKLESENLELKTSLKETIEAIEKIPEILGDFTHAFKYSNNPHANKFKGLLDSAKKKLPDK